MLEIENTGTALILRTGGIQAAISEHNGVTEFGVEYDGIPLDNARALIAEYDRVQCALPELPPGYTIGPYTMGRFLMSAVDDWMCVTESHDDAVAAAWRHFAATLDPKWAQLLRNAGLPV